MLFSEGIARQETFLKTGIKYRVRDRNGVIPAHTHGVGWCAGQGTVAGVYRAGTVHLLQGTGRVYRDTVRDAMVPGWYTGFLSPCSQEPRRPLYSSSSLLFSQEPRRSLYSSSSLFSSQEPRRPLYSSSLLLSLPRSPGGFFTPRLSSSQSLGAQEASLLLVSLLSLRGAQEASLLLVSSLQS